jgi:DNA-directed RNA polymerase subunit RPC12/RpoP
MQAKRAAALREEWGDKPCEHSTLAKEYAEGERTGDYVCTQCGAKVTFRQRAEILASRKT